MSQKSFFKTADGRNHAVTFFLIASLFLLWGFCNGMIDVMDKHFQDKLHLTKAQSAWVQFAHYLGYFIMALPASFLARKFGYKRGIISGLLLVALGGFWFVPATHIASFWAFLLGVCIIAMGLTILETVANPYTTVLGSKDYAAARINLAQTFNGVGWIFGPIVGGFFFYSGNGIEESHARIYIPYVFVAFVVLVMAGLFSFVTLPELKTADDYHGDGAGRSGPAGSIWRHPHFVGAVLAQFLYVAAQAGIFSFFINYMVTEVPAIPGFMIQSWFLKGGAALHDGAYYVNEQGASRLLGVLGFALFLTGRATGAALLRKLPSHLALGTYALVNAVLCSLVALRLGWVSVAAVFLSFFFMSIMFPTIFALGISGLGERAKKASAFIVMAIMGGAIMPKLMGLLGDIYNMSVSFLMPLACFALISVYGFAWARLSKPPSVD